MGSSGNPVVISGEDQPTDFAPLLCARCAAELEPGTGTFYRVSIEAVAAPTPPSVSAEDLTTDIRKRIKDLLQQMQDLSAQEAMDQVYRRPDAVLVRPLLSTVDRESHRLRLWRGKRGSRAETGKKCAKTIS